MAAVPCDRTFFLVPVLVHPPHGRVDLVERREPYEGEVIRGVSTFLRDLPEECLRVYLGEVCDDACLCFLGVWTGANFEKFRDVHCDVDL